MGAVSEPRSEGTRKAILVHPSAEADGRLGAPLGARLRAHLAALAQLPRRTLSLPIASADGAPAPIAAFVELWGSEETLREAIASWPTPTSAFLVEESLPVAVPQRWPSGQSTPGVRLVGSLHRKPGLDRAAFADHWRTRHLEVSLAFTIPVWHYSQNVVVEALAGDAGEDGFAVLHFRSDRDRIDRWAKHPGEARRGAEDAARFMAVGRGFSAVMTETRWDESWPAD